MEAWRAEGRDGPESRVNYEGEIPATVSKLFAGELAAPRREQDAVISTRTEVAKEDCQRPPSRRIENGWRRSPPAGLRVRIGATSRLRRSSRPPSSRVFGDSTHETTPTWLQHRRMVEAGSGSSRIREPASYRSSGVRTDAGSPGHWGTATVAGPRCRQAKSPLAHPVEAPAQGRSRAQATHAEHAT